MKDKKNFLQRVPIWLWGFIAIVVILLCFLPYFFTRPGKIDFTETGQIGDTIGGTMGPFVAIIAAFLTFIAFWVQYEANIKQRDDISVERQEAKFYKMLDIYSGISNGLEVHGIKGKEAFAELVGEFTYVFFLLDEIYYKILCSPKYLSTASPQIKNIIQQFNGDRKAYDEFLIGLAYNLFFYGKHYMIVDFNHPERTALGEELKKYAFSLNIINGEMSFADYAKGGAFEVNLNHVGMSHLLFEGHSDYLGHYFRHLYQTVKYVASLDETICGEDMKAGYVKLLRAQMSDYEQILLYFNSLTELGAAWNKDRGKRFPEDAGYIVRFRMIKNFPPNFPVFGVLPFLKYKEASAEWEKRGKLFFEHKRFPIANRSIDGKK